MSEITGGRASFRRVVQPAPYEAAEAMLEYSFTVEPEENAGEKGAEALALAKRQVLVAVGKAAAAAPDAPAEAVDDNKPAPAKKRGRPKKKDIMADDGDEAPTEGETPTEETGEISDQELQEAAKKAASRVSGATVRAYLSDKFDGTVQLSKLGQADRAKFIAGLDKLEKPKE